MLVYHRRFDDRRELYRSSTRGFLEYAERRAISAEEYVGRADPSRRGRGALARTGSRSIAIDALVEPTLPIVAPPRGDGYDEAFRDGDEVSLTHYWNWVGLPRRRASLRRRTPQPPAGRASRSSVRRAADWDLLAAGAALQAELGTVAP